VYINCVCTQRASGFSPCSLGSRRAREADKLQQAGVRRRKAREKSSSSVAAVKHLAGEEERRAQIYSVP